MIPDQKPSPRRSNLALQEPLSSPRFAPGHGQVPPNAVKPGICFLTAVTPLGSPAKQWICSRTRCVSLFYMSPSLFCETSATTTTASGNASVCLSTPRAGLSVREQEKAEVEAQRGQSVQSTTLPGSLCRKAAVETLVFTNLNMSCTIFTQRLNELLQSRG